MANHLYIVRHCEATGQAPDADLTTKGMEQAVTLANFFVSYDIDRIVSSPFVRARKSIAPLADRLNLEIEIDNRLSERVLSTAILSDWYERLQATFDDMDLSFEGGESSNVAMLRGVSVIQDIVNNPKKNTVIVTHGGLMTLMLKHFDPDFGFTQWEKLTNPDVFRLIINDKTRVERIWRPL